MVDFSRLSTNWRHWAPEIGGGNISVSTDCEDCQIFFSSDDYSVHLRTDGSWWVVDTVNDRGQRRNGAAKLSSFDLTEKYLIWDWATTARSSLASGRLGTELARRGYATGVEVTPANGGYKICLRNDCAILSVVNATIFSHLMSKSINEIEQMVREDLAK
ncbi:hypothetical protein [Mycobacterium heckeshornense]|uniref:Uncharacterized protein n=2 Tax=Mycobacterium heckeshornense TaxID=110505 RepID=A0A7R7JJN0_9MYCO|nr:hypothetical protein [Mycobacterium heckeshornense]BCO38090.1 hypothetical protein MHEC_45230 [Mycobacterium heckeshornense]